MQMGAENRTETIAALILTALAAVLVVVRFFPGSTPAAAPPTTSPATASRQPARRVVETSGKTNSASRSLDPTLRYDVLIAAEGDIVDRRYKVLRISPMAVEVEDVLNNNRQSIPLTQG